MHLQLIAITPDAEALIARCARVSHRSEGTGLESDRELIRRLIKLGHESVLEHAVATFAISGVSRACANQLTRHRLASFVQESQRYVDVRDRPLVRPPSFSDEDWQEARRLYADALTLYEGLVARGVAREDARFVLPIGAATQLVLTANFRELRHILRLRLARSAQWEIRELGRRMLTILLDHVPSVFEDLGGES
ncbi:MAG: Thymidylate synthase ThyX [Candidatus Bipolaricaulis sibiricus]|uniref:Flavin-dependent thymidylate synthase n=1 Tax=Bipolaricaulis sibiricus TaxID=2501609 RepID=A0A410FVT9_BIPS1|nr:MAG: Thymidylate synthase ThyX [Candidatus Bipolaricaulis sibiricus]